jgi:Rieske Fe-S protein
MERRAFLKSTCNICGLLATGFILPSLTGCGPAAYKVVHTEIHNDQIEIPVASFTATTPLFLVRPAGWLYSIALRKHEDNTYSALLLKCTHQDNQLTPSGSSGYTCSLHGSTFNPEGRVTKGPAERALRSYPVTADQTNVIIHLKA